MSIELFGRRVNKSLLCSSHNSASISLHLDDHCLPATVDISKHERKEGKCALCAVCSLQVTSFTVVDLIETFISYVEYLRSLVMFFLRLIANS